MDTRGRRGQNGILAQVGVGLIALALAGGRLTFAQVPATAPAPAAPAPEASGPAPAEELRQLAAAARTRAGDAAPSVKAGLERLAAEVERALAAGELPAATRAGDELTELLFELG
jgi:hypothetical protein